VATAMIKNGMFALGWKYINLDDCWADTTRDANGNIQPDPDRFPSGIPSLTKWLHDQGLSFGLYTSAGNQTCSSGGRPAPIPGSYGHYQQDADTFASWGVDYVKMDWCGSDLTNAQQQHTEFSNDLNATGRPIWFELCRGYSQPVPPPYTAQVAQSWRSTGDHHDNWSNTAGIIEQMSGIAKYGGPYAWNYADFLMTGGAGCDTTTPGNHCPGQTDDEYRTEFAIWSITASPLIISTDLRNMTSVMQQALLNTEIIAVNQDMVALPGQRIGGWNCSEGSSNCQIWGRLLNDGTYAIVLYNKGNQTHDITLDFSLIGWQSYSVDVRDLWAHKDLGTFKTSFTASVVSHGNSMVKLTKA